MIKIFKKVSGNTELNITLMLMVAVLFGVFMFKTIGGWISCNDYQSITDRQTKYSIINGCFVKTKSGWILKSEIRSEVSETRSENVE